MRGDADLLFGQFLIDMPILYPTVSLLPRAIEIAKMFRQSVYDSLYSALADREGCEHVTADDKYLRAGAIITAICDLACFFALSR